MKPSRLQLITTTHSQVHLMDTHCFYFTLAENAAIPLWNKLNQRNTILRQGHHNISSQTTQNFGRPMQLKSRKTDQKYNNPKIDKDPPLRLGDRVLIMNYNSHGLDPKFFGDWKVWKFNSDQQVIVQNPIGDLRTLSTRHVKMDHKR